MSTILCVYKFVTLIRFLAMSYALSFGATFIRWFTREVNP